MTLHQIAFLRTQKTFAKLTAEQLDTQFGGKVGKAAEALYQEEVEYLKEKCGCNDVHQECDCDEILVVSGNEGTLIFDERDIQD